MNNQPTAKNQLITKLLSEVEPKEIQWFPAEKFKIPRGMMTIFAGDPGVGKSFVVLKIICEATSRGYKALILSEDPDYIVKSRVQCMQGNEELICVMIGTRTPLVDNGSFHLKTDLAALRNTIEEFKPDFILLDPFLSYVGEKVDIFKGNQVRAALDPLVRLAEKYNFALVCILHLNKADTKALYKIADSMQFSAVAKSIYFVGKNTDLADPNNTVVCHLKTNISKNSSSWTFHIESDPQNESQAWLVWGEESSLTAEDLVKGSNSTARLVGKQTRCMDFTEGMLVRGPVLVSEWENECEMRGFSSATRKRVREQDLSVISLPPDKPGPGSSYRIALQGYERPTTLATDEPALPLQPLSTGETNQHNRVVAHPLTENPEKALSGQEDQDNQPKKGEPPLINEPPSQESGSASSSKEERPVEFTGLRRLS
jgi:hypothetical protein